MTLETAALVVLLWLAAGPLQAQAVFGGELFHFASTSTLLPPGICKLQMGVPVGATVVVIGAEDGNDYHITNVTDSQGNTYAQRLYYHNTDFQPTEHSIWSAVVTQALTTADTVSISWSPPPTEYRSYAVSVIYLTGVGASDDGMAKSNAYMHTDRVQIPGKTLAPNSVIVGMLVANDFDWNISAGWTIYRKERVNIYYHSFYKVVSAAGLVDPGGTGPAGNTYSGVWTAFASKPDAARK